MDDIAGGQDQLDLLADRDDHLARGHDVGRWKRLGVEFGPQGGQVDLVVEVVAIFPPPLLTDDDHGRLPHHVGAVDGNLVGVGFGAVELDEGNCREYGDHRHDDEGNRSPGQLGFGVAVDLLRPLVIGVLDHPVVPDEVGDHAEQGEHDHSGEDEHRIGEPVDVFGDRALGLERVELGVAGTPAEQQAHSSERPYRAEPAHVHTEPSE